MSSSAQTKRARRRGRAKRHSQRSTDKLNKALGEFLTEMGRVEFTMLLYADYINEAPIEHLFDEYSKLTFGPKVDWFKKWVEFGGVPADKRAIVVRVYDNLSTLRSKRNFLVHGETWQGAFGGQPRQAYRVGVVKQNLEYLDEFDRGQHGDNVFSVAEVNEVTKLCRDTVGDLNFLRGRGLPD
jgi:hypothetical protein